MNWENSQIPRWHCLGAAGKGCDGEPQGIFFFFISVLAGDFLGTLASWERWRPRRLLKITAALAGICKRLLPFGLEGDSKPRKARKPLKAWAVGKNYQLRRIGLAAVGDDGAPGEVATSSDLV